MNRDGSMLPKPELLAPAGSFAAACAALQYGADAIYLGLPRHSARAEAANLDADALRRIVHYAHSLVPRRSVFVTVNTLVYDSELPSVLETLELAAQAGSDALIIQDLGVYRLARRHLPNLPLHASTQMAVHDLEGVRALADLGFARVVLARELSLDEIAAIARQAPIAVEVFVHGALCYAYSGICLFSALQAGRSGNRGQCAYSCRERFTAPDGSAAYSFSMRDLALLDRLDDLRRAGAVSLKIEGRMKSPLYVAAVTDLYRRKLDGALSGHEAAGAIADLQTIFSRPWTELHLRGPQSPEQVIDAVAVGHRGTPIGRVEGVRGEGPDNERWLGFTTQRALEKHDGLQIERPEGGRPFGFGIARMRLTGRTRLEVTVPAGSRVEIALPPDAPPLPLGAPVFCSASQAVQRHFVVATPRAQDCRPAHPLKVSVTLDATGVRAHAESVEWPELAVDLEEAVPLEAARQAGQTATAVRKAFERLGESQWQLAELDVQDAEMRYAPPSLLNNLRRRLSDALDGLLAERRAAEHAVRLADLEAELAPQTTAPIVAPRYSVKVALATPPTPFSAADELVLALNAADCGASFDTALEAWQQALPGVPIRLALPPIIRGEADWRAVETAVQRLLGKGWTRWECGGLAALHLLRRLSDKPLSIQADGALYGLNRLACRQLGELGVEGVVAPAEADAAVLCTLAAQPSPRMIVPIYQRPALFVSETRPVVAPTSQPDETITLTDRRDRRFTVEQTDRRWLTRAYDPLLRLDQIPALVAAGVAELRVDLVGAVPRELAAIWTRCRGRGR